MSYRVEYKQFDPRTGFHWSGIDFDDMVEAYNFYNSLKGPADLFRFEKFKGYVFIKSKEY